MNPPDESVTKPLRRTFTLMENEAVQAKEAFLAQEYGKGKDHWQRLLSFVKTECEDHLHVKDVQATYSCRVKDQESMRKKIEKRQSHGQCQTLSHIYAHPGHWDFAGMRLCLYFPDQRRDVERFINTHEPFVPLPVREFDERIRLSTQEARIYQERMGLYNAQHYWLQLKKDHPSVQQHVPGYTDEKVEIQVRSVLMDAWAEVRHDFDYKVMNGYPSEDELRILDAIKGNIASCEILLDHLRNVRQERVTVDEQLFDKKKKLFWQEVICSLRPYHKLLLQVLDDGDSWSHEMLQSIFRDLKIYTPADLKGRMGSLNSPMDQQYEINRAHEAFALVSTQYSEANKPRMYTYFGDHGADALDDYTGPKHFQNSLSSFIAAYLFHKLPTTKLENICHGEILTYLKRRPCDVNGDHRAYCSLTTSAPECDLIWMRIACTIMSSLQKRAKNCKEDFPHRCYRIRAFSIAWHVHEWASIHCYDDQVKKHKEELQVTPMIVRMIEYFRKFQDSNADDNTAWALPHFTPRKFYESPGIAYYAYKQPSELCWARDWRYIGTIRHNGKNEIKHEFISSEYFTAKDCNNAINIAWIDGMQIAADILSITVAALKSLTLYRTLCQEDINLDYVQNCLRDPNININWCDFKGWSVLMTAAYCGFDSVCDILLAQPNLDVNSALPDGLTALYIALLMRRTKIVESLTRHKNINTKAIWKQRARFGVPEIDKLGRVEWTPGDVARAMGLEDCVSILE